MISEFRQLTLTDLFQDLGCGWGYALIHGVQKYGIEGLGLTLAKQLKLFSTDVAHA